MLRAIKFWGHYDDKVEFSNCSTKYEVLPFIAKDTANENQLVELALSNGWAIQGTAAVEQRSYRHGITLTAAIELTEVRKQNPSLYFKSEEKPRKVYLGFVTIPPCDALPVFDGVDKLVTSDQAYNVVNNQECSVAYTCDLDDEHYLVMEDWDYGHAIPFLGYSLESFEKELGIQGRTFSDEVTNCNECGEHMWESDGMTYNYRIVNECELLGIECGCFEAYCLKNAEEKYADNTDNAIELDIAEKLVKQGRIKFVERFIGGMVDGRGGYFAGKETREGTPKSVLAELKKTNPDTQYLFSHDESGQFQTYFSVWQVASPGKSFKTKRSSKRGVK